MLTELGKIELTKILYRTFGKHTFSKEELTSEFWSTLYISASDFFSVDGKGYNLDFFWSESVNEWLTANKEVWLKNHNINLNQQRSD